MLIHEWWLHTPTGRAWAVERRNDTVVAAAGPIDVADIVPRLLDYLMYFQSDAAWVNANSDEFTKINAVDRRPPLLRG